MMGLAQDITPMEYRMPVRDHVQIHLGFVSALHARRMVRRQVVLARLCVSRSL
jgi:hypothetical protein